MPACASTRSTTCSDWRAALHEFVVAPPLTERGDEPVSRLRRALRDQGRRTVRRSRRLDGALESLHTLRKAARRLRHAADALTDDPPGLFGRTVRRASKRAHRLQSLLGDHRDSLLLAARIDREQQLARRAGEDTAGLAAMSRAARGSGEESLAAVDRAVRRLRSVVAALKH